jgi:HEAT repeat protein
MKKFASVLLLLTVIARLGTAQAPADYEHGYINSFFVRLSRPDCINVFQSAMWTVTHDYKDHAHLDEVLKSTFAYLEAMQKYGAGDPEPFRKLGGVEGFRIKLSSLLVDNDQAIRSFGAALIGVSGDALLAPHVAKLLADRPLEEAEHFRYDRSRAAMALGMMGAIEYKTEIAKLIQSDDPYDRAGAFSALGDFRAIEYAPQAAAQLNARGTMSDDDVQAVIFLVETGTAKNYKRQLVKAMLEPIAGERAKAAMYALVSIDAKEHAIDVAKRLSAEFQKADAAKALGLMGATEYAPRIAVLLRDKSGLVRSAAHLSLGILGATSYADRVAAGLTDREVYVRGYAAISLLLMRSRRHYQKALEVYKGEKVDADEFATEFPQLVEPKVVALRDRLAAGLEDARKSK